MKDLEAVDFVQLVADITKFVQDVQPVIADAESIMVDLGLSQSSAIGKVNWQNLICEAIPIYNIFASFEGLPQMPLPSFCVVPAPVPTPAP